MTAGWSSFTITALVVSCTLTAICIQQIFVTPLGSKYKSTFLTRMLNLAFVSTESLYLLFSLQEYQQQQQPQPPTATATTSLSETRFAFEMIRFFFLSLCVLLFALDRLRYLYKTHVNASMPLWIRSILVTLCTVFNITLIITFAISMYSQSSFYWSVQLILLRFAVVLSCSVILAALCHIYYKFNHKIQCYLNTILSQHNQLKEIESISHKLLILDDNLSMTANSETNEQTATHRTLSKQDILSNNLNLAAKIREANYKLFCYILLLLSCAIIDFVYIPISIKRLLSTTHNGTYSSHLTPPYQLTSNLEWIFQRIAFQIIGVVLIYWMYSKHYSVLNVLCFNFRNKNYSKLCIVACLNCSVLTVLLQQLYLWLIGAMSAICPCFVSQTCLNLQQHIHDLKKYQNYFGHLPHTQCSPQRLPSSSHMNGRQNHNGMVSDGEESLPNMVYSQQTRPRSQSHAIFSSPPIVVNDHHMNMGHPQKQRRTSHASICGIEIATTTNTNGSNDHKIDHHRKQSSLLLQYDTLKTDEIKLSGTDEDADVFENDLDLYVPQQIIDEDAEKDDMEFDRMSCHSEQYDNFAEIMIERELDYYSGKSAQNVMDIVNGDQHEADKHSDDDIKIRRQSVELGKEARGSIGNLGKKRRNSLILNAVDTIKQGFQSMKEKQQQKKESHKEAQFLQQTTKSNDIHELNANDTDLTNGTTETDEDEKEYYNSNVRRTSSSSSSSSVSRHKRASKDRLSAIRNSLKSIIPNKRNKRSNTAAYGYDAVSMKEEHSLTFNDRNDYQPFEYATDTMIVHKHNHSDPLEVKATVTTSDDDDEEDDNVSLATYGTTQDCLDDDFESELNALSALDTSFISNNTSISPNKYRRQQLQKRASDGNMTTSTDEDADDGLDVGEDAVKHTNDEREKSVSLSLESISNSLDDEEEEEASPPPPVIIKKGNGLNMRTSTRARKNSVPLARIKEVDASDTNTVTTSADELDVTVTIDDISCDELMTASML